MKPKFLFLLLSLLIFSTSFSLEIDSLKSIVKTSKNDSIIFDTYNKLVRLYISYNIDSTPIFLEAQNEILLKNKFNEIQQNKNLLDWFNNSGVYNRRKGNYEKAISFFNKAYDVAEKIDDKSSQAIALNNIANVHYTQGNYLISMDYHFKALKIRKAINDTAGIAMSLGNIGLIYESRNDFEKAIENYKKSREYFTLLNNKLAIAWCDRALGVAYLDKEKYTEAKVYLHESYTICKSFDNYEDMKFSLINLSSVYLNLFEENNNKIYLDTVSDLINRIELLHKQQATYRPLASFLMTKAKYNYFKSAYHNSILLLDSAENIIKDLDLKNELKDLYLLKSQIYEESNNSVKALLYHKKYKAISDTIFNLEKEKEIGRKEAWFEYEEQLKLEKLRNVNEQQILKAEQKIQVLIMLSVSLLLIIVIIIFIFIYRKKQVHFKQLEYEKDDILKKYNSLETAYSKIHSNLANIKDKSGNELKEILINKPIPEWINDLSKREIEVLSCIAIGLTDKQIENKLFISITTVRSHCRSIYRKLLVKNRVEAANIAKEYGLI